MIDDTPWDFINSRYERDELRQFELIFDGIEQVVRLARSTRLSDRRLALIIVDHLTDIVLARRVKQVIALGEGGPVFESRERFDARTRSLIRQRFSRRVDIAARDLSRRFTFGSGRQIIHAKDAEILRVMHAYRNDIYHDDRHNDVALGPITTAAVHALGRGWVASLPDNVASSRGVGTPLMGRLLELGYSAPRWSSLTRTLSTLSLHAGAQAVTRWALEQLPLQLVAVRRTLAEDAIARANWAERTVEWLSGPHGPGRDEIDPALRWYDLWRQHSADPDLLAFAESRALAYEERMTRAEAGESTEAADTKIEGSDSAYNRRFSELVDAHVPTLTLADLPRIKDGGASLARSKSIHTLLARYRALDLEVRVYEDTLSEMAMDWDQYVETESERRRGK